MDEEKRYIQKRIWKARFQSIPFYLCRIFPMKRKKIVFCCIEGTTGYTCNPKYIAEEFIRRNGEYDLVWLVNDIKKEFPREIKVVHNTLWNRAYHLSTAGFWIDNSRKQMEVRKRRGQIYIQTWHAKMGFKPTCLNRGASFSQIAYLISRHDSDMIDYVLSNSEWYDDTLPAGMLYNGAVLRTGSPRCDILVKDRTEQKKWVRSRFKLPKDANILMYAPTFRGGSQKTGRTIETNQKFPDYKRLSRALQSRFGGRWYIFLRLHPQLVARNLDACAKDSMVINVSRVDDMYEILSGCDAFMTDYSSAAFDAAVMKVPVFLYVEDYQAYEQERGKLLWDLKKLPFPLAEDDKELEEQIRRFNVDEYLSDLETLFRETGLTEDGNAAIHVADVIEDQVGRGKKAGIEKEKLL